MAAVPDYLQVTKSNKLSLPNPFASSGRRFSRPAAGLQTKGRHIPRKSRRVNGEERLRQALLETDQGAIAQTNS